VHLPQPPRKSSHLSALFYLLFIYFLNDFFNRVCGHFLPRPREFKNTKKALLLEHTWAHQVWLFFLRFFSPPSVVLLDFFVSRFWAFRKKGSLKTRLKKPRNLFLSRQKSTHSLTYVTSPPFFSWRPLLLTWQAHRNTRTSWATSAQAPRSVTRSPRRAYMT
jgi:hypothetical protein